MRQDEMGALLLTTKQDWRPFVAWRGYQLGRKLDI